MTGQMVASIALAFPEVTESPHFEKSSFRVRKKIFATLNSEKSELVVKLSLVDQSVFCDILAKYVRPVSGGWGKKGWTAIDLSAIDEEPLVDILKTAYKEVAPISLANLLEE